MTKEFLNKFSIGDSVHVDARVVGMHLSEDGETSYTVDVSTGSGGEEVLDRVYNVPECFIAKVF